jgi:hypothetical protein
MRRLLAWVAGLAGGAAAYRAWRRAPQPLPSTEPDPAEALRAKLAEAKAARPDRDEFESGEQPVDAADPDERRRAVHERGRAAVDEMRGDDSE